MLIVVSQLKNYHMSIFHNQISKCIDLIIHARCARVIIKDCIRKTFLLELLHIWLLLLIKRPLNYWKTLKCILYMKYNKLWLSSVHEECLWKTNFSWNLWHLKAYKKIVQFILNKVGQTNDFFISSYWYMYLNHCILLNLLILSY